MFETLMRLYSENNLTESGLNRAVRKGWITETQKEQIIAEKGE